MVPWAGYGDDDLMIVVPHPGLDTTQFNVEPAVRSTAVATAYASVKLQLVDPVLSAKLGVAFPDTRQLVVPTVGAPLLPEPSAWHELTRTFVLAAVLAFFVGSLGWFAVNAQAGANWFWQSLLIGLGSLVAAVIGLVLFARSAGGRAAAHARVGIGQTTHATKPALAVLAVALVVFVGGGVLSSHVAKVRRETTHRVAIVRAERVDRLKVYDVVWEDTRYRFASTADLALGEVVYVKIEGTRIRLEKPLASPLFPFAIGLEVLGLGLFLGAYRASSWARRSNRLVAWLAGRRPAPSTTPKSL